MNDITKALAKLELELRKGIVEGEYFGDSYICGIADKLMEIQEMIRKINFEPCTIVGGNMSDNSIILQFEVPDSVKGIRLTSNASVILERNCKKKA